MRRLPYERRLRRAEALLQQRDREVRGVRNVHRLSGFGAAMPRHRPLRAVPLERRLRGHDAHLRSGRAQVQGGLHLRRELRRAESALQYRSR